MIKTRLGWWWWCRQCNNEDTCNEFKKTGRCQRTRSFGWTDQPEKNPTPVPSEGRFQASPKQTSPNPKSRKKIARHARLTSHSFGGRGAQSFPSPRRWMPWIRNDHGRYSWTCLPGKPDPCPKITTGIRMKTRSKKLPFTTTMTDPGKDQLGKTHGKKIGAVSELQSAIKGQPTRKKPTKTTRQT